MIFSKYDKLQKFTIVEDPADRMEIYRGRIIRLTLDDSESNNVRQTTYCKIMIIRERYFDPEDELSYNTDVVIENKQLKYFIIYTWRSFKNAWQGNYLREFFFSSREGKKILYTISFAIMSGIFFFVFSHSITIIINVQGDSQ